MTAEQAQEMTDAIVSRYEEVSLDFSCGKVVRMICALAVLDGFAAGLAVAADILERSK